MSPAPRRPGFILLRLAKWLAAGAVCLALLLALGVWLAGRAIPGLVSGLLGEKASSGLTCEVNKTNLFVGRIHLENLVLLNPPPYRQPEAIRVRRIVLDVEPASFLGDGRREIEEMEIDLDRVTLVGGADPLRDNNLAALGRALSAGAQAAAEPAPGEERPVDFRIRKLRLRVGGLTLIQAAPGEEGRVIAKDDKGLAFEAADVTAENFSNTVLLPLVGAATQRSLANPDLLRELSRPRSK